MIIFVVQFKTNDMKQFIKTSEKVEVENYPYGYTLRTTLFDSIEFNAKKGYRHVTQTINPKNGRLNNAKKSTYYPLMVRYYNEDNHIKTVVFDFNGDESMMKVVRFLRENFDFFTKPEIVSIYNNLLVGSIVGMKAKVIYCGSKFEDLKPLYDDFINLSKKGIKDGLNYFGEMVLDIEKIKSTEDPNYQPFRTVQSQII